MTVLEALLKPFVSYLMTSVGNALVSVFSGALSAMLENIFFVENYLGAAVWGAALDNIYQFLYWFSAGLLCLKLIYKGIKIYGFWKDGDADNDPKQMLIGCGWAMGVTLAFPLLYEILANVVIYIFNSAYSFMEAAFETELTFDLIDMITSQAVARDLFYIIFILVWLVMFIVVFFKLLIQGFVMMIWRLGVPIAAVGQLDSDGGIWKSYLQVMFQLVATILTQTILWILGLYLAVRSFNDGWLPLILGLASLFSASKVPQYLGRIMAPSGSGGSMMQLSTLLVSGARLAAGGI